MLLGPDNALIQQPTQDGLVKGGVTSLWPGVCFIHYELESVLQILIDWLSDRSTTITAVKRFKYLSPNYDHILLQMEKHRGLSWKGKKQTKNPRK